MTSTAPEVASRIRAFTSVCFSTMPEISRIVDGVATRDELRRYAALHYAEIRTFIDFKLPERMRLCPTDAVSAKRYFCDIYKEEQGDFVAGRNHADMFLPLCQRLGLSQAELNSTLESYWPQYAYMLTETPSFEVMVRELAISYAWESFVPSFGIRLTGALRSHYGLTESADLAYFEAHGVLDTGHSEAALQTLVSYLTSAEREEIAEHAIRQTLVTNSYLAQ